jgi:EmrB/QacA subfamily drug resistance transporter
MQTKTADNKAENIELAADFTNEAPSKWWILVAVGIGTFMSALDGSVVNTILPVVGRSYDSSVAQIEWVVTIYLLVLSGLMLSFGRLGDMRGHKNVYLTGFVVFLISSALCGTAPSITWLILFRGVQAIGGAMLSANSPAILTKCFPASQRGQALGIQATMTYLGLTVGPSLGGFLTDQFSWRAVFYINLPVGAAALWLSMKHISQDKPEKITERFDPLGAGLFLVGLVMLLFGLNQGHALGWGSPIILGCILFSIVLLILFVIVERRNANPMLDLSLFSGNSAFSGTVTSAILNYICVYSILFLMPFYLIQGLKLSTAQTGLVLTAQPIIMALISPISGTLSDRIGTRYPTFLGMLITATGLFFLSRLNAFSSMSGIVLALGLVGLGTGTFISPNTSALMGAAPRHRQGIASGILATARNTGMALGVGFSGAIFTSLLGQSEGATSGALFDAFHASILFTVFIALLGAVISVFRNDERIEPKPISNPG